MHWYYYPHITVQKSIYSYFFYKGEGKIPND